MRFFHLLWTMYLVHADMFFCNRTCTCIPFLLVMNAVYLQVNSFSLVDAERDYLSLDKRYPRLFVSPEFSKVSLHFILKMSSR